MTGNGLTVEIKDRLAVLTFNRIQRKNAIDKDVYIAVTNALNDISARDDVSITVLTGSNDYYSSGNDLKSILNQQEEFSTLIKERLLLVRQFVEAFINHSKVLVAAVNGPAIGIAATTLPLCDIVYCSPSAWFSTPFTRLGICAEGCSSYTFPRLFGNSKASELLLFGTKLTAEEAFKYGLVSKVVTPDKWNEEIWKPLKDNAMKLGPKSLAATKKLMRRYAKEKLHDINRKECEILQTLFESDEAMEAAASFFLSKSKL